MHARVRVLPWQYSSTVVAHWGVALTKKRKKKKNERGAGGGMINYVITCTRKVLQVWSHITIAKCSAIALLPTHNSRTTMVIYRYRYRYRNTYDSRAAHLGYEGGAASPDGVTGDTLELNLR